MSPDDLIRLRHMVEAAQAALRFCQGRQRADLDSDDMLRFCTDACRADRRRGRRQGFGGWACAGSRYRVAVMVGMRNRLVHAYFDIQ